jgi:hypothetical protein
LPLTPAHLCSKNYASRALPGNDGMQELFFAFRDDESIVARLAARVQMQTARRALRFKNYAF